jgi:iron-sulfur cluster assembly accessory protein
MPELVKSYFSSFFSNNDAGRERHPDAIPHVRGISGFKRPRMRLGSLRNMITLTTEAIGELAGLLAAKAATPDAGLRLAVRRGGCAGWQYEMKVDQPQEGDVVVEQAGARIILAGDSVEHLAGCEIDFSNDLTDSGFKIRNPRAARSCGCGTSFEPLDEAGSTDPSADGEACGNA